MANTVYLDNFANEYVLNTDIIAPPERYIKVERGKNKVFVEHWYFENGRTTSIEFDEDTYSENARHFRDLEEFKESSKLSRMYCWEVPSNTFDMILKEIGIK